MEARRSTSKNNAMFIKAKSQFTVVVQQELQTLRAAGLSNADAQAELCRRLDLSSEPIMAHRVDFMTRTYNLSIPAATLAAALQPSAAAQLKGAACVSDVISALCLKLATPSSVHTASLETFGTSSKSTDAVIADSIRVGGQKRRSEATSADAFDATCSASELVGALAKTYQAPPPMLTPHKRPRGAVGITAGAAAAEA
jgi:hypothetical protein